MGLSTGWMERGGELSNESQTSLMQTGDTGQGMGKSVC